MNIISNNCCGAFYYDQNNMKQLNPFRYCWFDVKSVYNIVFNYENINFRNYELQKDNNWNFYINIDNKVKLNLIHHKFDSTAITPYKKGDDIFYSKIWEYIIEKYEMRLNRMTEKPLFIIDCGGFNGWNDDLVKEFYKHDFEKPVVLIIHTKHLNDVLSSKKNLKLLYTDNLTPREIMQMFNKEITDYFLNIQ